VAVVVCADNDFGDLIRNRIYSAPRASEVRSYAVVDATGAMVSCIDELETRVLCQLYDDWNDAGQAEAAQLPADPKKATDTA
jgi:hypothetical protein